MIYYMIKKIFNIMNKLDNDHQLIYIDNDPINYGQSIVQLFVIYIVNRLILIDPRVESRSKSRFMSS